MLGCPDAAAALEARRGAVGAEPAEHGSGEYEQRGVHAAAGAQCNGGDPCGAVSRSGAAKPGGGAAGGRLYHPAAELSAKCVRAVLTSI